MSTTNPDPPSPAGARPLPEPTRRPWATGLALFAGVVMLVTGVLAALAGIAALLDDDVYVGVQGYVYAFDLTGWGWIHLILGVLVAAAGAGVLAGQLWARGIGILLASLSLIANFLFLPYSPWWSILIIALDVAVIWALSVYRTEGARG
ncbi:hypothetical protein PSU4_00350 [Pseudonocardia sulfidoxydans NBRC 16205]|uniref:DUF7144 domain-containing protein n=1 Tax=Pseudonocardia sulfidoxydans NBRC 16205 TaxID=1223511 RepID=A0A511D8F8_9PSEU|nr:hypothetical protein [Pseudonocardia sulfidoxydans]GEL21081.1 hypothetical protein PSU4_00350 [Pseudonocardia sulfidoxydans NBRC 16205]